MPRFECLRCGHIWIPRTDNKPKFCPKCNSPYWDRPRKVKAGGMIYTSTGTPSVICSAVLPVKFCHL